MSVTVPSQAGDLAPRLLHIVPRLPPPFEGVGGYAQALEAALAQRFERQNAFLIGDPSWRRGAETGDAAILPLAKREATALQHLLERELESGTVLLHYANYGFDPHGCPGWLIEGLERWRRRGPTRRLITFFHEVYASGPPWRRSFWQGRRQRRLAERLARASDHLATSLPIYRDLLAPWIEGRPVEILPVPSTIGETREPAPLGARPPLLVLFGSAGVRRRAYGPYREDLVVTCRTFGVEGICDVGIPVDHPERIDGVPVRSRGELPAPEIRRLLAASRIGFLAYPPDFLPKSTVFAAYSACGVLPVCAWRGPVAGGELEAGRHYWRPEPRSSRAGAAEEIAGCAAAWYRGHSIDRQAEAFGRLLQATEASR